MSEPLFQIGADGVDAAAIEAEIRSSVDSRITAGAFADARIGRAERLTLVNLRRDGAFITHYLRSLRDAVEVDISDFEIRERRAGLAPLLVRLKKAIWGLLRFYTYRLWSQQNQVNSMLAAGLEGIDEQYAAKIRRLEERLAELERRGGGTQGG
ncbi:MAG: hypothetical protein FJ221_05680 [Lentisphaerae bacterium]|nr:hypothetical protein [Lentisphaerota bacterium]